MILFKFIFNLLHSYDVFLGRDVCVIHAFAMGQCDFKCKVSTHAASCLLYIFTCNMKQHGCNKYPLMLLHVVCKNVQ